MKEFIEYFEESIKCNFHSRLMKRLKRSEIELLYSLIEDLKDFEPNERAKKINRLFIDNIPPKTKNHMIILELLISANSKAYREFYE
jgi:hypothetical protein